MPFRLCLGSPITLAILAAVAIGYISFQILTNNQKRRLPASRRRCSRGARRPDSSDDDDDPEVPGKPDKGSRGSIQDAGYHSGDGTGVSDKAGSTVTGSRESEKSDSGPNELRKRTNILKSVDDTREPENLSVKYNDFNSSLSSFDRNSEAPSNINNQTRNVSLQSRENQESDANIRQMSDNLTGFVRNISDSDSDSDSAESSNSQNSIKTDCSSTDSNESVCDNESSCTTKHENIRVPSPIDSEEEIYKRKVCDNLKNDMENENCSSKSYRDEYFEDFSDANSDVSENSFSVCSGATSNLTTSPGKPKLCKGCLEEFANAVVYPCKHCYLCLDCAIKVHRIYKKCSICHMVIKTFERSDA